MNKSYEVNLDNDISKEFLVTHKNLSNALFYFYEDIENSFVVESGKHYQMQNNTY